MKKRQVKEVEVVVDVFCDVCGKSCQQAGTEQHLEYGSLKANWGYYSNHDGQRYDIHLCENCFFQALANLREARRSLRMFDEEFDTITAPEVDPLSEK